MEVTVASASNSLKACNTCEMHSQPALVESAYWNGEVAASTAGPSCWATVLATNRLMTSPTTIPRTPPSFLRRAVIRPIRRIWTVLSGTTPLENPSATKQEMEVLWVLQKGRRWSLVIPDVTTSNSSSGRPHVLREETLVQMKDGSWRQFRDWVLRNCMATTECCQRDSSAGCQLGSLQCLDPKRALPVWPKSVWPNPVWFSFVDVWMPSASSAHSQLARNNSVH